jgi:hypothetical protein
MKKDFDIDIDFANRETILTAIDHIPASIAREDRAIKHNTGVYVTDIPYDSLAGMSAIDHKVAEDLGYIKLDFLNMSLYEFIDSPEQLDYLLSLDIPWHRLHEKNFVERTVHIANHYYTMRALPEPINSIERMAMFLALIRPGKKHLIGKTWKEIGKEIWLKTDDEYSFRKAHAIAYSRLVTLNMIMLDQGMKCSFD